MTRPPAASQRIEPRTGPFVGRERELVELSLGLEDVLAGQGRLFLIAGEPGIGKSRLADEVAAKGRDRGMRVLWGRCWEAGGAPPYWPWVQTLRAYIREVEPERLRVQLGRGAPAVAQMLPELRELFPALRDLATVDPETERFRLFDATALFLRKAADVQPLLLLIDDLHAADAPSLLLLRFLAAELHEARIFVAAAYRDPEAVRGDPLAATVADVVRHATARKLALVGLTELDVAQYVERATGTAPAPELVSAVHEETEGNPLFLGEIVRLLAAEGLLERPDAALRLAIPQGVRQVIARRLDRLSEPCSSVLSVASVLGREFELEALERLVGIGRVELLELLEEARAERIVTDVPGALGRLRFSHALVRDTLYDELPQARRLRLHREAGEALEALYADNVESSLAELAHHFAEAAPAGEIEKAIEYARRAAEQAMRLLAYEEGARLFELALRVLDLRHGLDRRIRCELLVALGDAQARAGDGPASNETFLCAAGVARGEDAGLFATAALGYGGRFLWARAGTDPHVIPLLEEALAALGPEDSSLRVRAMTRLAGALRDQHDPEPRAALSRDAVDAARRLGDAGALAYALEGRASAIMWPDNADERAAIAAELAHVAAHSGDVERAAHAAYTRAVTSLELGDLALVHESLEDYARITAELRQPAWRWLLIVTRATLAFFEGRLDEAERLTDEALAIGARAQPTDATLSQRIQVFTLRLFRGALDASEDDLRRSIVEYPARPMFRCMLAYLLAEVGRADEARTLFQSLAHDRFSALPWTNEWLFSLAFLADVAHSLGDASRALTLYELLLPHAGRNACTADYIATGSVARALGTAAATAARWDEAEHHFENALEMNSRMGARPWIAWTAADWAEMLLQRGGAGDDAHAAQLRAEALETAQELGMTALEARIASLANESTRALSEPTARAVVAPMVFRREGEYWSIAYERDAIRVKDSKGLRYLARLLAQPGRELHVLDLLATERGVAPRQRPLEGEVRTSPPGDAGELLDAQAKTEYRRRLSELDEELEEARAFGDFERATRVEEERDFLVSELARALGLGGRHRRAGSPAERARVSVTRAIRAALARIREHSPPLGEHFDRTIHTGAFCSYRPDPRAPADWQL